MSLSGWEVECVFSERDAVLKNEHTTLLRAICCTPAMLVEEIQYKYWFILITGSHLLHLVLGSFQILIFLYKAVPSSRKQNNIALFWVWRGSYIFSTFKPPKSQHISTRLTDFRLAGKTNVKRIASNSSVVYLTSFGFPNTKAEHEEFKFAPKSVNISAHD